MSDYKEILSQVTGPGDAATVLIAGTAGLVVDAALSIHGFLSPGAVGIAAAGGALGLKKSWEAALANKKARDRRRSAPKLVLQKANKAIEFLTEANFMEGVNHLKDDLRLYELGLLDDANFDLAIDRILTAYRDRT